MDGSIHVHIGSDRLAGVAGRIEGFLAKKCIDHYRKSREALRFVVERLAKARSVQ
jgi:hypothetical protein